MTSLSVKVHIIEVFVLAADFHPASILQQRAGLTKSVHRPDSGRIL
jgi:hypothetical protein